MAVTPRKILIRLYVVAAGLFLFAGGVVFKLVNLQAADGEKGLELAFHVPPDVPLTHYQYYVERMKEMTLDPEGFRPRH